MIHTIPNLPYTLPNTVPMFPVPEAIRGYMKSIIGHVLQYTQNEAIAGNGDYRTQFWGLCLSNQLQNPLMTELLTHAAALGFQQIIGNPQIAVNSNQWGQSIAQNIVPGFVQTWVSRQPAIMQSAPPNVQQTIGQAAQQYSQYMGQVLQMFQQGLQQGQQQMGWGQQQNPWGQQQQQNFGYQNQGWNNGQQGQGWNNGGGQMWGQNGGYFNANGFGAQMQNNAYNPQGGNHFQTMSTPGISLINNGRTGKLDALPTQSSYNGNQVNNQQQQTGFDWATGKVTHSNPEPVQPTYTANPNQPGNGFAKVAGVSNGGQQAITPSFGGGAELSVAASTFHTDDLVRMQDAPLQSLNLVDAAARSQERMAAVKSTVPLQPPAVRRILNPPTRYACKIPLPGGRFQRHTRFFNGKTQASVCDLDANNVIIREHIVAIEDIGTYMNFEEHNTAPYLVRRGTEESSVSSAKSLTEISQAAMRNVWLDTARESVMLENEGLTVDSPELSAKLRNYVTDRTVTLDKVVAGTHRHAFEQVNQFITKQGIDALMDEVPVIASVIDLDPLSLDGEYVSAMQEIMDQKDADKMQHCFNVLHRFLPERLWVRLDRDITNYINLELYMNYGLSVSIDSFSTDIADLVNVMISDTYSIEYGECERLIQAIGRKFFAAYAKNNDAGQSTNVEWGDSTDISLGELSRYAFLPITNQDLQLTGNRDLAIVTADAAPELYQVIQRAFPNLAYATDPTRHSYLVTAEGEYILVNKPYGLGQYNLYRRAVTNFVNPLMQD